MQPGCTWSGTVVQASSSRAKMNQPHCIQADIHAEGLGSVPQQPCCMSQIRLSILLVNLFAEEPTNASVIALLAHRDNSAARWCLFLKLLPPDQSFAAPNLLLSAACMSALQGCCRHYSVGLQVSMLLVLEC